MPSLQIRDLPRHLFEALSARAQRERRSLAQQAVVELEKLERGAGRRAETVAKIRRRLLAAPPPAVSQSPVDAIRKDRER